MSDKGKRTLPEGWVVTTIGDITEPSRPRHPPGDYPNLPFIGMEHIEAHTMRLLDTVPAHTMKSSAVHFWPGDVLYGRLRPYLNKVYRPEFEGLCSAEFIVFPASQHLDSAYVQYYLNSSDFVSFASGLNTGDRPRVDFEQLASRSIPLAPLPEQHRIVAEIEKHFTRLEASVAELERAQANLKRYRAAVLRAACEGRLVPTEAELARAEGREYEPADVLLVRILKERRARWEADQLAKMQAKGKAAKDDQWKAKYEEPATPDTSNLPSLPEGWAWASVGQVVLSSQNGLSKRHGEQGIPTRVLRLSDIIERRISEDSPRLIPLTDKELAAFRLNFGDVVCIRVNGSRDLVGRLVPFQSSNPWAYCDHFIRLTTVREAIQEKYLSLCGELPSSRRHVELRLVSSAGQNTVSQPTALGLPVPLAPLAEQYRIVAEVERRFSVIDGLETIIQHSLRRADRLRQSVLKRAFEGKLAPQDPDDEPASVMLERIRAERGTPTHAPDSRREGRPSRKRRMPKTAASLSTRRAGVAE